MVSFFKKISNRLPAKGRAGKYLSYALGEILLVVIGILIALKINNWNALKNDRRLEAVYLQNIQADLEDQLEAVDVQLNKEFQYMKAARSLLYSFDRNQKIVVDSILYQKTTFLTSRKTFIVTHPTYTDLISSGNIKLLRNRELKDNFLKYHQELKRVEAIIQHNNSTGVDQEFLSTMNRMTYYYLNSGNFPEPKSMQASQKYGPMIYNARLQGISGRLLNSEENVLIFINAINYRYRIASANAVSLENLKEETSNLLNKMYSSAPPH